MDAKEVTSDMTNVRLIRLSARGKKRIVYAVVDADRYDELKQYSWCWFKGGSGKLYAETGVSYSKPILMHRFIMNPKDGMIVDHINGDTLDNRVSNLRVCTMSQNNFNRGASKVSKTGYKGVSPFKGGYRWRADISANGIHEYLGLFKTPEQAARAYNKAAKKHHGKFARLNIINKKEREAQS